MTTLTFPDDSDDDDEPALTAIASQPWTVFMVLPGLGLQKPIRTEYVALVRANDPCVHGAKERTPDLTFILDKWTDAYGSPLVPAVLLARTDAPPALTSQGLLDFRNALALCAILAAWPQVAPHCGPPGPLWSDLFDGFPVQPSNQAGTLVSRTSAVTAISASSRLKCVLDPRLPSPSSLEDRLRLDSALWRALLHLWHSHNIRGRPLGWRHRQVFRALEVAFHALALADKNGPSHHDAGTRIALWVSAFEILAHPPKENANLKKVWELLASAPDRPRLPAKFRGKKSGRIDIVKKAYSEIYGARNDFLHGNPVTPASLRFKRRRDGMPLTVAAPLLFRLALAAALGPTTSARGSTEIAEGSLLWDAVLRISARWDDL